MMKGLRHILVILALLMLALPMTAQTRGRFNPKRFKLELQQFITREAGLTPAEVARFFPLFNEMQEKQRLLFEEMRTYRFADTSSEKASRDAIKKMDDIDLKMKKLQRDYHEKFCRVLPATKVLKTIKAEEKFHRRAFKRMMKRRPRR